MCLFMLCHFYQKYTVKGIFFSFKFRIPGNFLVFFLPLIFRFVLKCFKHPIQIMCVYLFEILLFPRNIHIFKCSYYLFFLPIFKHLVTLLFSFLFALHLFFVSRISITFVLRFELYLLFLFYLRFTCSFSSLLSIYALICRILYYKSLIFITCSHFTETQLKKKNSF